MKLPASYTAEKKHVLFLLGTVLVLIWASWNAWMKPEPGQDTFVSRQETVSGDEQKTVTVYINGAVKSPGVYDLPEGSRVSDAILAAGDVIPYAAVDQMDLAGLLSDGTKITVPMGTEANRTAAGSAGALVNINTAGETELDALPGIGPSAARKIIEYRNENGTFRQKEELKKVSSIGEGKYKKLQDQITI